MFVLTTNLRFVPSVVKEREKHNERRDERRHRKQEKWQRASAKVYQSHCPHFPVNNFQPSDWNLCQIYQPATQQQSISLLIFHRNRIPTDTNDQPKQSHAWFCFILFLGVRIYTKTIFTSNSEMERHVVKKRTIDTLNRISRTTAEWLWHEGLFKLNIAFAKRAEQTENFPPPPKNGCFRNAK